MCAIAAFVASSAALHAELMRVLGAADAIIARHPGAGALLFVALAAVSATLAFFSSVVTVPVAVYAWGAPAAALLLWIGWLIGGAAAYAVGRLLGRPVVAALTSAAALARLEDRVSRRGSFLAVLLVQLALPSEVPGYVLGLAHYGLWRYLAVLAVAELPYAIGTVVLGAAFLERRTPVVLAAGAAALLLGAGALALGRRRSRPRDAARPARYQGVGR